MYKLTKFFNTLMYLCMNKSGQIFEIVYFVQIKFSSILISFVQHNIIIPKEIIFNVDLNHKRHSNVVFLIAAKVLILTMIEYIVQYIFCIKHVIQSRHTVRAYTLLLSIFASLVYGILTNNSIHTTTVHNHKSSFEKSINIVVDIFT